MNSSRTLLSKTPRRSCRRSSLLAATSSHKKRNRMLFPSHQLLRIPLPRIRVNKVGVRPLAPMAVFISWLPCLCNTSVVQIYYTNLTRKEEQVGDKVSRMVSRYIGELEGKVEKTASKPVTFSMQMSDREHAKLVWLANNL